MSQWVLLRLVYSRNMSCQQEIEVQQLGMFAKHVPLTYNA
jgi:hypothetical protein